MSDLINTVMSNPAPDMYKQFTVVWLLRLGLLCIALNLGYIAVALTGDILKWRKS